MPSDTLPAIAVGAVLLFLSVGLAYREWSSWNIGPRHLPPEDATRQHAERQLRRRLRVSLLMLLAAVLIPLGDVLPFYRDSARLFAIHWLGVLAIVVLMVLLALGDLASSMAFNRMAQSELNRERDSLREQIRRFREQRPDEQEPRTQGRLRPQPKG